MSQVTITLNGRHYAIGCADGEENRLLSLAGELDRRMGDLVAEVGQVGDARLMVMLGLLLLDEIDELRSEEREAGSDPEDKAARIIERLAERAESLAARLERT